jgi:hypothetical protein
LAHLLKIAGWPDSDAAAHWQAEAIACLGEATEDATASIRRKLDLPDLYARALVQVRTERIDRRPPRDLPAECPCTLDDLLRRIRDPAAMSDLLAPLTER